MKLNKKLVQGLIVGGATVVGSIIAACVKEKNQVDSGEILEVEYEGSPVEEVSAEG